MCVCECERERVNVRARADAFMCANGRVRAHVQDKIPFAQTPRLASYTNTYTRARTHTYLWLRGGGRSRFRHASIAELTVAGLRIAVIVIFVVP